MVVTLLLRHGAIVNGDPLTLGNTALDWAVQGGHAQVVAVLLRHGAQVERANTSGSFPLYVAAQCGRADVAEQLIAAGARLNRCSCSGASPLVIAAVSGHAAVVDHLLAAGADVNLADRNSASPLWWAAHYGREAVVRKLIAAGAALDQARNDGSRGRLDGMTPLQVAEHDARHPSPATAGQDTVNHHAVVALLRQAATAPEDRAKEAWGALCADALEALTNGRARGSIKTLSVIAKNVVEKGAGDAGAKYRSLKRSNVKVAEHICAQPAAVALLAGLGFIEQGDKLTLAPDYDAPLLRFAVEQLAIAEVCLLCFQREVN